MYLFINSYAVSFMQRRSSSCKFDFGCKETEFYKVVRVKKLLLATVC